MDDRCLACKCSFQKIQRGYNRYSLKTVTDVETAIAIFPSITSTTGFLCNLCARYIRSNPATIRYKKTQIYTLGKRKISKSALDENCTQSSLVTEDKKRGQLSHLAEDERRKSDAEHERSSKESLKGTTQMSVTAQDVPGVSQQEACRGLQAAIDYVVLHPTMPTDIADMLKEAKMAIEMYVEEDDIELFVEDGFAMDHAEYTKRTSNEIRNSMLHDHGYSLENAAATSQLGPVSEITSAKQQLDHVSHDQTVSSIQILPQLSAPSILVDGIEQTSWLTASPDVIVDDKHNSDILPHSLDCQIEQMEVSELSDIENNITYVFTSECNLCGMIFATDRELQIHKRNYTSCCKCPICYISLKSKRLLFCHMEHGHGIYPKSSRSNEDATEMMQKVCRCSRCGECFPSDNELRKHQDIYPECFQCRSCGEPIYTINSFSKHIQLYHQGIYKCVVCHQTQKTMSLAQAHLGLHIKNTEMCSDTFHTVHKYLLKKNNMPEISSCQICGVQYPKVNMREFAVWAEHFIAFPASEPGIYRIAEELRLRCHFCKEDFQYSTYLHAHRRRCHKGMKYMYKCPLCDVEYEMDSKLQIHIQKHNINNCKECSKCRKQFRSYPNLLKHTKACPDLTCRICEANFPYMVYLTKHMDTCHAGETHPCVTCGLQCTSFRELLEHRNTTHGADGNRRICTLCSKSFISKSKLQRHTKTHTNTGEIFQCKTCDKVFKKSSHLMQHAIKHSQVSLFKCPKCPRTFKMMGGLKLHSKSHLGPKSFQCEICDMTYFSRRSLLQHSQDTHLISDVSVIGGSHQ